MMLRGFARGAAAVAGLALAVVGMASAGVVETDAQEFASGPSVTMMDTRFFPAQVSVPADTGVSISLSNWGVTQHDFVIPALGVASGSYMPGQAGSVWVSAPAGAYEFLCSIPGHKEAGMVGMLYAN
jgi:plastocyanin